MLTTMASISALLVVLLIAAFCSSVSSTQQLTGRYGCFASPDFPSNYPHNRRQSYRITVTPGSRIKLSFITFSLEQHPQCDYDYLQIREKDGSVARKLCGGTNPGDITSQDNELFIEFKSDQSVNSQGFFSVFVITNSSLPTPLPSPSPVNGGWCPYNWTACSVSCGFGYEYGSRSCSCPPPANGGLSCSGSSHETRNCSRAPCPSLTTPSPSCGGFFTSLNGSFASPGFPNNYPNNARCTYEIRVPSDRRIVLEFQFYDLESCCDRLVLRQMVSGSNREVATLSGTRNSPIQYISAENRFMLMFTSDHSVTSRGFTATYRTLVYTTSSSSVPLPTSSSSIPLPRPSPSPVPGCGGFFTSLNGSFTSPGFPNNYPNNARCTYEIYVPSDRRIVLEFQFYDFESCCDRLVIRQMVSGSNNEVATLTGTRNSAIQYISTENRFTLQFTSDGSVTRRGFTASYSTIPSSSPPVNGGWCSWFQLTPCSASCGYGSQVMMRYCSCPLPSNGGSNCTGPARRTESCYAGYCPTSSSTTTSSSIPMPRPSPSPVPGCQPQLHTASSGIIRSPGYPNNYFDNANCVYNITVQDGKAIKIEFSTFDLESSSGCPYDKLQIFEGKSSVPKATLCDSGAKTYTSRGNKVFMRFTSDGSVTRQGFYGTYQTVDRPQGGGATVNDPECGIRKVPQSRVIGGVDAAKGAWPWQIGMYYGGRFICGGTLIAPNWVLTAAHCVESGSASNYEIVVGDLHRQLNDTTEQKHDVEVIVSHPSYSRSTINNDIALMKLKTPVMMNDHVLTACIPNKTDVIPVGSRCFITGWGKIQHPGNSHIMLQQAMLPVLNSTFCQSKIDKLGWGLKITDQMVCAGEVGSKKSGCHGDSGGPFVCPDRTGRFYLHGDVSWGSGQCDTSQAYTVFARVTEFVDWIKETLKDY